MNFLDILCLQEILFNFLKLDDIYNVICINKNILSLYKKGKIVISTSILFKNIIYNNNILKQLTKLEHKIIKESERRKRSRTKKKEHFKDTRRK